VPPHQVHNLRDLARQILEHFSQLGAISVDG
jgi:hypothetical protein